MTDCSLISDGAAAIIIASDDVARNHDKAIRFRSNDHVQDVLPMSRRRLTAFEGRHGRSPRVRPRAGITVNDLDFAEIHDCFTIAELLVYEAMELAPKGEGCFGGSITGTPSTPTAPLPIKPVRWTQGEGAPGRSHRRVDARHVGHATRR